jgi:hypothetical protein
VQSTLPYLAAYTLIFQEARPIAFRAQRKSVPDGILNIARSRRVSGPAIFCGDYCEESATHDSPRNADCELGRFYSRGCNLGQFRWHFKHALRHRNSTYNAGANPIADAIARALRARVNVAIVKYHWSVKEPNKKSERRGKEWGWKGDNEQSRLRLGHIQRICAVYMPPPWGRSSDRSPLSAHGPAHARRS